MKKNIMFMVVILIVFVFSVDWVCIEFIVLECFE